jgi:hypothetical protein
MISRNLKLLIMLIGIATIAAYVVLVIIPTQLTKRSYEAAQALGEDFRQAFQFTPEVSVNHTIILNQQTPVLELAVLSQNFEHRYTWANKWMGSTKQIAISGTFVAKTGFDLKQKFSISLKNDTAYVALPEPTVLSVESQNDISYRDENGIWNWVNPEDRTKATNAFMADARKYAEHAAFVQDARKDMEGKLKTIIQPHAKVVLIQYREVVELPLQ